MHLRSNYRIFKLILISIYLLTVCTVLRCQEQKNIPELKLKEQPKNPDDLLKTLSRSKASVWVDTNKGNIFSTSIGSSHLEKDRKDMTNKEPVGRSSNMLLTLLVQPGSSTPVQAVTNGDGNDSNLKPILLLLQQQQDLSEILLEKQEKIEKMNVHLQQQVKHQHLLIVDLLEQIKMFLDVINSPNYATVKPPTEELDRMKVKHTPIDQHLNSASSSANAIVFAPKKKGPDNQNNTINNNLDKLDLTVPAIIPAIIPEIPPKIYRNNRKIEPILATSNSETVGRIKRYQNEKENHS